MLSAEQSVHACYDYLLYQNSIWRIYAYTDDTNMSSQHLCERLGMRQEAVHGVCELCQKLGRHAAV